MRFPGFSGEWIEKRLQELFKEFKSGNGITSSDIKETGEFSVFGGNGFRGYTNTYTHDGFYLLIGRQGALCGNINRSYGRSYISEHAIAGMANNESDTEWLAQRLDYYNLNKLSESSAQPGLSVAKLLRFKLIVPKKKEQQKIATFLTTIDQRIETQNKIIEELKTFKLGLSNQIFLGKVKLTDFDEPWKRIQLKEVLVIPEKIKPSSIDKNKLLTVKLHLKGISRNDNSDTLSIGSTNYYVRKKGQLIYGKQNLFNGALAMVPEEYDGFLSSGDVPALDIIDSKIDPEFLFQYISRPSYYKRLESIASGSGSKRIHENNLLSQSIMVPSIKRQQKIATTLSAIDQKIDLESRLLELLKQQKLYFLQNIFI
ncbi:restriction endonuclease subunit S [Echinicola marina]|uniref:restriction endonuclease subunit S n=1 Tax=Echinicola marina TaxID=2859768 RepID=UPI001CF6D4CD|nr:restriction endonuclease subunit S [Echinicola marina]UCS95294.1 restriction endonuclease subunit S [Echinicola marina]